MVNKVLLATDGSENATRAANYTLTMAKNNPLMEVTILNVRLSVDIIVKYHPFDNHEVNKKISETSNDIISNIRSMFEDEGLYVQSDIIFGQPGKAIAEYANVKQYDMVIMGTRGLSNLSGIILGSVSHQVLNYSTVPVLFVKGSSLMINRVLLASDGSENAARATEFTLAMTKSNPSLEVTILHVRPCVDIVVKYHPFDNQVINQKITEMSKSIIKQTKAAFDDEGVFVESDMILGEPGKAIAKYAREKKYDMIIMGTRGLSNLSGIILGSISHQVLHYSTVPVLFVK